MISNRYINAKDLIDVKKKDKVWAAGIIEDYYFGWSVSPLTKNKNVELLRSYAHGRQDVAHIKKSLFKLMSSNAYAENSTVPRSTISKMIKQDLTGIEWKPVSILSNIINSAKANLIKQPLSPVCTAIDPIAREHRLEDMMKLKYEKFINDDLDALAKKVKIKVSKQRDTQYTDMSVDINSLDLDPMNDDELQLYQNMFTKLSVESAMEVMLDYDLYKNKMNIIKNMLLDDHYVLAVSCYERYMNKVTGLPDVKYYDPSQVRVPYSYLPDYSDVPFVWVTQNMRLEEWMKRFSPELNDVSEIAEMFNSVSTANGWRTMWADYNTPELRRQRNEIIIPMVRMQWKSWDGYKLVETTTKSKKKYVDIESIEYEPEPSSYGSKDVKEKWKQCTYDAFYLPTNKRVYGFTKLDATYNAYGDESMSTFSLCMYQSAEESPVERSVVLVDNFQRAFFKAQHALLKSRPAGYNINLKHLRNAVDNVKEDGYNWKSLLEMFFQENILLTDSSDIDEKETTNNPAVREIAGTNMQDVVLYFNIMAMIKAEIREITGINDVRDAVTPNPDALVGIQKLALEASLNATYYIDDAIKHTLEDGYRYAACLISKILKPENKKSKPYEALMAYAGRVKTSILEAASRIPAHQYGIKIQDMPTEAQKAFTQSIIIEMYKGGKLDAADLFAIERVSNYKDAEALAIVRQRKKELRESKSQAAAIAAPMMMKQAELQTKEKVAQTLTVGQIHEEEIRAKSAENIAILEGKIDLLIKQLQGNTKLMDTDKKIAGKLADTQISNQGKLATEVKKVEMSAAKELQK